MAPLCWEGKIERKGVWGFSAPEGRRQRGSSPCLAEQDTHEATCGSCPVGNRSPHLSPGHDWEHSCIFINGSIRHTSSAIRKPGPPQGHSLSHIPAPSCALPVPDVRQRSSSATSCQHHTSSFPSPIPSRALDCSPMLLKLDVPERGPPALRPSPQGLFKEPQLVALPQPQLQEGCHPPPPSPSLARRSIPVAPGTDEHK